MRAPEKGKVKTRLAKGIGAEAALRFYELCVEHSLTSLDKSGFPIRICYYPPDKEGAVSSWLGNGRLLLPQAGDNLGTRMASAFSQAFEAGFSRAVLVGADIPGLTSEILHEAFLFMDRHDAAIGPADDGGYYLIGFRSDPFRPSVFSGISWGSETVFRQTMQRFKIDGISVHVLSRLTDIDTLDDLRNYIHGAPDGSFLSEWAEEILKEGGC